MKNTPESKQNKTCNFYKWYWLMEDDFLSECYMHCSCDSKTASVTQKCCIFGYALLHIGYMLQTLWD